MNGCRLIVKLYHCSQGMKKVNEEGKIGRKLSDHKLNRRSDAEWLHLKPLGEGKGCSVMQQLYVCGCHYNLSCLLQTLTAQLPPATTVTMTRSAQSSRRRNLPPTRRRWQPQTLTCLPPRRTVVKPSGTDTDTDTLTEETVTQIRR